MKSPIASPPPHLTPERWKEFPDILTDSLWNLGSRARGDGRTGGAYHGNFVPQIPDQLIRRFTAPFGIVLDMFCGSGTTLVECLRLGRHGIGIELQEPVRAAAAENLRALPNPYGTAIGLVCGDSTSHELREDLRGRLAEIRPDDPTVDLVLLHPPYWNIIKFSEHANDLSGAETLEVFLAMLSGVINNAYQLARPGAYLALIIGDMYRKGEYIPLGMECMTRCQARGWKLRAINVKDMQGNEKGKGSRANLWRYRALKSGLYVFRHEYVMVFRKPVKA